MNFKLTALILSICVFQLACAWGGWDRSRPERPMMEKGGKIEEKYGKDRDMKYDTPKRNDMDGYRRQDNLEYNRPTHYGSYDKYGNEKVWVQNVNDNVNDNDAKTWSENESKNDNWNINELINLIKKLQKENESY
ncbi:unnamed protein product [Brachionus calyciflorus]|uniref:Uncharacterized protein n=1 Tax=Brachionus calyciflorus TaxID=104777 RepID=A0A813LZT8_9BILA|nr:unnamed protein product [Brachionus calyciflorus]